MIISDSRQMHLQADQLGGKARRLAEIKNLGFPVPPFFVVTPGNVEIGEVAQAMKSLGASAFAVRSSSAVEDGTESSFAGQFLSVLNRKTPEEVAAAIDAVRASSTAPMTVIVQTMVPAEFAGVLFTADPTTGDHQVAVLSFTRGLGDKVVNGDANCTEVRVDLRSTQVEFVGPVKEQSLSSAQILRIVRVGLDIAASYQYPQDIEWCWSEGIKIVQTRPITSGNIRRRQSLETAVFDNSNIQESFCGITLPLTFSFASYAYHQVYRQLMRVAGFSEREVARHDERHRNMLSYVNGHVYYNIRSWYDGLRLLPAFQRNKEDMEKMMGVEHPVEFVQSERLSWPEKIKVLPKLLRAFTFLIWSFARIDGLHLRFVAGFEQKIRDFDQNNIYRLSALETLVKIKRAKQVLLADWATPIINDFYVMVFSGKVRRALRKVSLESEMSALLAGEDLASTAPTKRLMRLASRIRRDPDAAAWFLEEVFGPHSLRDFRQRSPELAAELTSYIEDYGDRVVGELKLESVALWQDPTFVFDVLKSMVSAGADAARLIASERQMRQQAEARVFQKLPTRRFRHDLERFRKGVRLREDMRLKRTRAFGLFRRLYGHLGYILARQQALADARDIFYLTENEIQAYFETRSAHRDLKRLIELRKSEFAEFAACEPPGHFRSCLPIYHQSRFETPAQDRHSLTHLRMWHGLGCYPGVVRAQVVVLRQPERNLNLSGKILCTMRTDPGWAPLFSNLAGLLVERGSTLSHSAVIARELGLPTVVGAPGVTTELKTGDWIQLNGLTGDVQLLTVGGLRKEQDEFASLTH